MRNATILPRVLADAVSRTGFLTLFVAIMRIMTSPDIIVPLTLGQSYVAERDGGKMNKSTVLYLVYITRLVCGRKWKNKNKSNGVD